MSIGDGTRRFEGFWLADSSVLIPTHLNDTTLVPQEDTPSTWSHVNVSQVVLEFAQCVKFNRLRERKATCRLNVDPQELNLQKFSWISRWSDRNLPGLFGFGQFYHGIKKRVLVRFKVGAWNPGQGESWKLEAMKKEKHKFPVRWSRILQNPSEMCHFSSLSRSYLPSLLLRTAACLSRQICKPQVKGQPVHKRWLIWLNNYYAIMQILHE